MRTDGPCLEAGIHKELGVKFPAGRTGNSSTRTANFLWNNADLSPNRLCLRAMICSWHLAEHLTRSGFGGKAGNRFRLAEYR